MTVAEALLLANPVTVMSPTTEALTANEPLSIVCSARTMKSKPVTA